MNHPYVPGAVLRPNTPFDLQIPTDACEIPPPHDLDLEVDVATHQTITVISVREHERDRLMWWITALFPDGKVHTGLMFKDDFVPV